MQPLIPRRDPAPSRMAYRINRLWLTPGFRLLLRVGLPSGLIFAAVATWFSYAEHRTQFTDKIAEIRRSIEERPEFMVKLMAIDGASEELAADVREVLPLDFPVSSFDLDLHQMQDQIEELDAVARADLRIRPGGILQADITERVPAVVWRGPEALELLDVYGNRVAAADSRANHPDLPLIAGEGADKAVAEAVRLIVASETIQTRVRGLVRMGERRWDIVLDNDQRILLPEEDPVRALEQVIALDQAQELLDRDVLVVDLRNAARPTLRLAPHANSEMTRIKALELGAKVNE